MLTFVLVIDPLEDLSSRQPDLPEALVGHSFGVQVDLGASQNLARAAVPVVEAGRSPSLGGLVEEGGTCRQHTVATGSNWT